MLDYVDVALHAPLYTYHLLETVAAFITTLPWPDGVHWFTTITTFTGISCIRFVMHRYILKDEPYRHHKKRRDVKRTTDHHIVSATIGSEMMSNLHH